MQVAGWEFDPQYYNSEELTSIKMPIVSRDKCRIHHPRITSIEGVNSLFCASYKPGLAMCKGDDGAGFMFEQNGQYYIRGVISQGIGYQNEVTCDSKHFIAVTDIVSFLPWIKENM